MNVASAGRALRRVRRILGEGGGRRESGTTLPAGSEGAPYPGLARPLVLVPVLLLAFWPVWRWYIARMSDGSDDPLGLVALLTAVCLLPRAGWLGTVAPGALAVAGGVLALYVAGFDHAPPLVRGVLAVLALACVLPGNTARSPLPTLALLLLSLPVIATLQFYLGYPSRALTTWCAAQVLNLGGYAIEAQGTVLRWAGEEILVDAPCSGIRMLWTASYLSATLAALFRLTGLRVLRLAQVTAAAVFLANLARTIFLFFLETGLWLNPPWAHETAGLAMFAVAAVTCVVTARRLAMRTPTTAPRETDRATWRSRQDLSTGHSVMRGTGA